MKILNFKLLMALTILTSTATGYAKKPIPPARDTALESVQRDLLDKNYAVAAQHAAAEILKIRHELQVDAVIFTTHNQIDRILKEVKTSQMKEEIHASLKGGIFGLFSMRLGSDYYSNETETKIVQTNLKAYQKDLKKIGDDFKKIQDFLKNYVFINADQIAVMKLLTLQYLKAASLMSDTSRDLVDIDLARELASLSRNTRFHSQQFITSCDTIKHAGYKNSERSVQRAGLSALFSLIRGSAFLSREETEVYFPYTETDCNSEVRTSTIESSNSLEMRINFGYLDRAIANKLKVLNLKLDILQNQYLFPTFSNPYYE